jgi:hypothetical protein
MDLIIYAKELKQMERIAREKIANERKVQKAEEKGEERGQKKGQKDVLALLDQGYTARQIRARLKEKK